MKELVRIDPGRGLGPPNRVQAKWVLEIAGEGYFRAVLEDGHSRRKVAADEYRRFETLRGRHGLSAYGVNPAVVDFWRAGHERQKGCGHDGAKDLAHLHTAFPDASAMGLKSVGDICTHRDLGPGQVRLPEVASFLHVVTDDAAPLGQKAPSPMSEHDASFGTRFGLLQTKAHRYCSAGLNTSTAAHAHPTAVRAAGPSRSATLICASAASR